MSPCLHHCFPRFEKMISGKYLGEVARRVILQCSQKGLLFETDRLSPVLKTPDGFQTKYLSEIERLNFYLSVTYCKICSQSIHLFLSQ